MNTAVRRSTVAASSLARNEMMKRERPDGPLRPDATRRTSLESPARGKVRVYIAAENRLMREALSRMLLKRGEIDVLGLNSAGPLRAEDLSETQADILLLTSRGSMGEDLAMIRQVRVTAPAVRVLLAGLTEDEGDFLQYVSAGISGYLRREASAEDVLEAIDALHNGEAVCPGVPVLATEIPAILDR